MDELAAVWTVYKSLLWISSPSSLAERALDKNLFSCNKPFTAESQD